MSKTKLKQNTARSIRSAGMAAMSLLAVSVVAPAHVHAKGLSELVAFGAPLSDVAGSDSGRVHVFTNNGSGALTSLTTFSGASAGDNYGYSVAVFDYNGDNQADLAVGAPFADLGGTPFGKVYVYTGSSSGFTATVVTMNSPNSAAEYGKRVANAGDVNGDGYDDLAVGAPYDSSALSAAGRVYIYFGGAGAFNTTADATIDGTQANGHFGYALAGGEDLDNDGYEDLIVGAPDYDVTLLGTIVDAGRVYIYRGGNPFTTVAASSPFGTAAGARYGASVAMTASLNNDNYADFVVGAPETDIGATTDAGRAHVYFGGSPTLWTGVGSLSGVAAGDHFGAAVAAGYYAGTGSDDVVVGAYGNDAGGTDAGRVYVFNGAAGASFNTVVDSTHTGAASYDYFGYSLSLSTQTFSEDLLVGAPLTGALAPGAAHLLSPAGTDVENGAASGDYFGWSVAGGRP